MVLSGLLTNLAAKSGRPQVAHSKKNEAETYALWASLSNNSIMEKMSLISAVVLLFDLFIRGHVVMETLGHHQYKLKVHQ